MLCFNGGGGGCNTKPPKPLEGDFLFSPFFVWRSPLQGDNARMFGALFLSAKQCDPTGWSGLPTTVMLASCTNLAMWGHGTAIATVLGQQAIWLCCLWAPWMCGCATSCAVTSPVTCPASSLAIAMPAEDNGAIPSLHPLHKKQRLLLFLVLFVWLHHCRCHNAAAGADDHSVGIFPRQKRKWILNLSILNIPPPIHVLSKITMPHWAALPQSILFQSVDLVLF